MLSRIPRPSGWRASPSAPSCCLSSMSLTGSTNKESSMRHVLADLAVFLWGFLIMAGLLILAGLLLAMVSPAQAQPSCSHWASPGGSATSSQCTDAAPCRIMTWLNNSSMTIPGATLCLKSGTYTGSESMISIPESFAGTAERPITIRALEPGKVTIDGQRPTDRSTRKGATASSKGLMRVAVITKW